MRWSIINSGVMQWAKQIIILCDNGKVTGGRAAPIGDFSRFYSRYREK
jgi:hypothetical protein